MAAPLSSLTAPNEARDTLDLLEALAGIGHWRLDLQTRRVNWSDGMYRIYGVTRDTFSPVIDALALCHSPEDRAELRAHLARARTGQGFQCKFGLIRPSDGSERIVTTNVVVRTAPDRAAPVLFGVLRDITVEENAKAKLVASELSFRQLAQNSTDIIARYTYDGTFIYLSPAVERVLGYKPCELIGRKTLDLVAAEDRARVVAQFRRYVKAGPGAPSIRVEYRALHRDGRTVWLEAHPGPAFDSAGRVMEFSDVARDVTDRRAAETALAKSEARYRLLTENATDIVTESDLGGVFRFVSPAVTAVTGYSLPEVVGRPALDFVHPDDRDRVRAEIGATLAASDGRKIEHRHIRKDGRVIWIESQPKLARDPQTGRPFAVTDVMRDITARKVADAVIAESEARYRLLADNANDMIAQFDQSGEITFISPGCIKVLGYAPEEMIGKRIIDMSHPQDVALVNSYRDALVAAGPNGLGRPLQFRARHRAGHWVWLEGQPKILVHPETGEFSSMQDVLRDVTKRKALEVELENAKLQAEAATLSAMREIGERRLMEKQLRAAAETDPLTGLPNRRTFLRRLEASILSCGLGRVGSLAMIDLDFFKRINDEHGHAGGDTALMLFADICRDLVRSNDLVARIGGEEFALILNGADVCEAVRVCDRLRERLSGSPIPMSAGRTLLLSASIGVARIRAQATCDELLATADALLYRAKANGRNRVVAEA